MNWLRKFMNGRYGGDQLSKVFLVLSLLVTFIGWLTKIPLISIIAYVPLVVSLLRMFSKDINKRRMENYKFSMLISPIYSKLKKAEKRIQGSKTHRYFKCPDCNEKMRVPKGKGKIMITCPKCKTKYEKRT